MTLVTCRLHLPTNIGLSVAVMYIMGTGEGLTRD